MHIYILWIKTLILQGLAPSLLLFHYPLDLTIVCFWSNLTIFLAKFTPKRASVYFKTVMSFLIGNLKFHVEKSAHGNWTLPGSKQFIWRAVVLNVTAKVRALYKAKFEKIQWKSYSKASSPLPQISWHHSYFINSLFSYFINSLHCSEVVHCSLDPNIIYFKVF